MNELIELEELTVEAMQHVVGAGGLAGGIGGGDSVSPLGGLDSRIEGGCVSLCGGNLAGGME